ncbi:MAG: hypothetical protein ACJ790_04255, partial [Myxococcaceae bacterium]
MKWRVFWIGLAALVAGFGALAALTRVGPTPDPRVLTCEEFEEERPTQGYFQLVDCEPDLARSSFLAVKHSGIVGTVLDVTRGPGVKHVLVPLRSVTAPKDQPAAVVLAVSDPAFISDFRQLAAEELHPDAHALFGQNDDSRLARWAARTVFTGTLGWSPEYGDTYVELGDAILPGAMVMELDRAPRPTFTPGMLVLGMIVLAGLIAVGRRIRSGVRQWRATEVDHPALKLGELEEL